MTPRELKDLAWIGDAVLALYARQWLLQQPDHPLFTRQERFIRFTANDFLQSIGEPTRVEAGIGQIYQSDGLDAAFKHIEETLQPLFAKHLNNAVKGRRGQRL
jgi:hypothetical protein